MSGWGEKGETGLTPTATRCVVSGPGVDPDATPVGGRAAKKTCHMRVPTDIRDSTYFRIYTYNLAVTGSGRPIFRKETTTYSVFYIGGLGLIALIAVLSYLLADRMAVHQGIFASQINVAGRQRMLVQRIGLEASQFRAGDLGAVVRLRQLTDQLEQAHLALISGGALEDMALYQSANVDRIYFEPPHNLDEQLRQFISLARTVAAARSANPGSVKVSIDRLLSTARQGLPDSLSIAVKAYEADANAHVQKLRNILLAMLLVLLLTLIAESLFLFRPMFRRIREQHQELSDMARTDPLTGSHNRRRFIELAEAELARIRRTGQTASVLILDIDKFKNINDTHGHAIGDEAIRTMAQTCVDQLRGIDIFGRIGGEEFCIVLPETGVDNGLVAAEKLRKAVENSRTPLEDGNHLTFTVSIGLSPMTAETDSLHAAMEQADSNLYKAKQTGRNRVVGPENPQ